MIIYVLLGAIGVPVLANFSGGFQHLIGPTGGFLFGSYFLQNCHYILFQNTLVYKGRLHISRTCEKDSRRDYTRDAGRYL